jgi:hypothetical protein
VGVGDSGAFLDRHSHAASDDTARRQAFSGRRVDGSAECAGGAEANIVKKHDQHIRRPCRRPQRFDRREARLRILRVEGCHTDILPARDRQHAPPNDVGHGYSLHRGKSRPDTANTD